MNTQTLSVAISQATGRAFSAKSMWTVGGGCVSDARILTDGVCPYFVKIHRADRADMFEAEFSGLAELRHANVIRVPRPICTGCDSHDAWLVLEHIRFGNGNSTTQTRLGEQLAHLHRHTHTRFGWHRDNTLGSTPQINHETKVGETGDWVNFLREHRLGYQFALAQSHGADSALMRAGELLLAGLEAFFTGYPPEPSLLHGDLWSGNVASDENGQPVIFDPAVYYGDREADLAMTELFGGFSREFRAAYHATWPLDPGYRTRRDLYNLYHVLNHYNLFGGGYLAQATDMTRRLAAEIA